MHHGGLAQGDMTTSALMQTMKLHQNNFARAGHPHSAAPYVVWAQPQIGADAQMPRAHSCTAADGLSSTAPLYIRRLAEWPVDSWHASIWNKHASLCCCAGPLLEQEGIVIGIVTAIAAPSSLKMKFTGAGVHAGTLK